PHEPELPVPPHVPRIRDHSLREPREPRSGGRHEVLLRGASAQAARGARRPDAGRRDPGDLAMSQRTVTSNDVAALAGVSQASVSRVLRGDSRVSPATRDRVLAACAALNYTPNALARAMRSNSTGVVGLVVADIHNPFYCEAIEQFSAEVLRRDRSIVIWNADSDRAAIRAAQERFIDGLVFTAAVPSSPLLETAIERGVPV